MYTSANKNRVSYEKEQIQIKDQALYQRIREHQKETNMTKPRKIRRSMGTTSPTSLTQRDVTKTTGLKLGPGGSKHLGCTPQDAQVNLDAKGRVRRILYENVSSLL